MSELRDALVDLNDSASLFSGLPSPTSQLSDEVDLHGSNASTTSTRLLPSPPPSFSPRGTHKRLWFAFLCFSIFLLVLLPVFVEWMIRRGVLKQIIIDSPHAMGFPMFLNRTSQGGTLMKYTFFNITNPHQVLAGTERPHLEEIGPFIYQQTQVRHDAQFDHENDLLSFRQQIYQTFDPVATSLATGGRFTTDQVRFCTINILFFGMSSVVGNEAWHLINDVTLWNTDFKRLFAFNTVLETIEGYTVPLKVGPVTIPIPFPGLVPSFRDKSLPHSIEYKYVNKIFMGKKNLSRTNTLWEWGPGKREALVPCPWGNNPLSTDCSKFKHNPCCGMGLMVKPWGEEIVPGLWNANANEVQGTFGDAFRPYLKRSEEEKVVVWSDQLYRPLQFSNRHRTAVNLHNIHLLRFTATREFWSNATVHPPNARYHQFGPNGLVNASIIYLGAPIYVSLPHFLDADPSLLEGVTGLRPDPLQHEMFLDIEPTTGMTFRERNRIQINAKITGNVGKWFPHVKTCYVPVGYFDAHSEINQLGVDAFLELYNGMSILYGAMAFGAVCLIVAVCGSPAYSWFKTHHRRRGNQHKMLREHSLRSVLVLDDDGEAASLT